MDMILISLTPAISSVARLVQRLNSIYSRQKRLMNVIADAVGPTLPRAVAGRAVDLVIHFDVPWSEIESLLALQRQIRSSDFHGAKIFEIGLRRIAKQHGVAWVAWGDGPGQPYWKLGGKFP